MKVSKHNPLLGIQDLDEELVFALTASDSNMFYSQTIGTEDVMHFLHTHLKDILIQRTPDKI